MDINYILGREQISLHNASVAISLPARIAHSQLATAYGALLTETPFPHRVSRPLVDRVQPVEDIADWENEGGAASTFEDA